MSNQIQKEDQLRNNIRHIIAKSEGQIRKALPRTADPNRMFRVYMTAVQTTPNLFKCDPISIVGAVMQAAQFGLSLDTVMGEAYLIPRWNKKLGGHVANFQIGYKGLRKLALQGDPELRDMFAQWVYRNDIFEFELGESPRIVRHIPSEDDEPGELRCAYVVAVWKDDYRRSFVMLGRDIIKIRNSSDGYQKAMHEDKSSPWITHPEQMWRKTAFRAFTNQMQLATESPLAQALAQEDVDGKTFLGPNVDVMPMTNHPSTDIRQPPGEPPAAPPSVLDVAAEKVETELSEPAPTPPEEPPTSTEDPAPPAQEPTKDPPKASRRGSKKS